jgi:hypothetical protein
MSKSNTNEYLKLSALTKNLIIIEPDNKTDSYELIKKSQIVVNFCSSIGIEANYLRKPIVQIGPSSFRLLPAANYVNSADDAIKMIESNSYKLMPIRASIIWFTYLSKFEYELSNFKVINNGLWYFENERIKSSYFLRLLAVPSKIYTNILKSNYSFITKFPLYISNLITNKYKV